MSATTTAPVIKPKDFLNLDHLLSDEERDMRDSVRAFVTKEINP
jgi:glutaryl-CoA dehydrogenase